MNTETLIKLTRAGIKSGEQWLVRDVSLEVNRGEILTLIGPNGAGKTTTAKLALGLLEVTEGEAAQALGLTIGYVPQKLMIDWTLPLTVWRFLRLTQDCTLTEATEALEATDSSRLLHADLKSLSGGEFQRVLLSRAILKKPDLLVLDEPVQGVDFTGEQALYRLIERIRTRFGCGILLISHDLHIVMSSTDRVICLNGHVCCSGTPDLVSNSPEFRKLFGPQLASNIAIYEHMHDHHHAPDGHIESHSNCADHLQVDRG